MGPIFFLQAIQSFNFAFSKRKLCNGEIFDPEISMIFDIFEFPESKYVFCGKCLCVRMCVYGCVCMYVYVCYKFVYSVTRNWTEISSSSLASILSLF